MLRDFFIANELFATSSESDKNGQTEDKIAFRTTSEIKNGPRRSSTEGYLKYINYVTNYAEKPVCRHL